jgi:hypothetical protein
MIWLWALTSAWIKRALAWIVAGAVAIGAVWRSATVREQDKRAAEDAKAYQDKRKEIDNADLGHGATDVERIKRLQSIADRAGIGGDRR